LNGTNEAAQGRELGIEVRTEWDWHLRHWNWKRGILWNGTGNEVYNGMELERGILWNGTKGLALPLSLCQARCPHTASQSLHTPVRSPAGIPASQEAPASVETGLSHNTWGRREGGEERV